MSIGFGLEQKQESVVKIKVVGVGGGGCNVVNRMAAEGPRDVEYIAINTDKQALDNSAASQKVQIGEKLTHGQGAGSDPAIGGKSAEESRSQIAKALDGADMVFITAGMGGGTGTGAAPVVADIARDAGILTVGVVTKPFTFEGGRRMRQAEQGIETLRAKVDSLVIIPNSRLKLATGQNVTLANAFEIADSVLLQALLSISDLIRKTGFINLDFADVRSVMKDAGLAHMGVGRAAGKDKAESAARMAVSSPLMETSISAARGILINITGSMDIGLDEVEQAATTVQSAVHSDANIIFGATFDETMDDEIRVTVIATGFEANQKRLESVSEAKPTPPRQKYEIAAEHQQETVEVENVGDSQKEPPVVPKQVPVTPPAVIAAPKAQKQEERAALSPTEAFYGMLSDLEAEPKFQMKTESAVQKAHRMDEDQRDTMEMPTFSTSTKEEVDPTDPWEAIRRIFMGREDRNA